MIHNSQTGTFSPINAVPTAYITVNRNRLKIYDTKIYLKDGTQFEIELFNPKTTRVLASISINGKFISDKGIILNPGQRVSIERWIDTASPRKFKFSTYEVENSEETKNAISNNGLVIVWFYDEVVKNFFPNGYLQGTVITTYPSYSPTVPYVYYNNVSTGINETFNDSSFSLTSSSNVVSTFTSTSSDNTLKTAANLADSNKIETGIIEQGDFSNQSFTEAFGDFNAWSTKTYEWHIFPESTKHVEADKIRSYCTECGVRVRATSWKFCPSCGEKIK